jgi:hypothetical protein
MDMNNMEEDQVLHDATQVIGNSGTSSSIMGLHDVLRNIEQILAPFKHYIEASEASMASSSYGTSSSYGISSSSFLRCSSHSCKGA